MALKSITIHGLVAGWLAAALPLSAQDYSVLRINEVIADNRTQGPRDVGGGTPDIVEILNTGDEILDLGFSSPALSVGLSDRERLPADASSLWVFRSGVRILPRQAILVYCDGNQTEDECEPHASFSIDTDGGEPISLWGPVRGDGTRQLIDQVWLPPLRADVSFGRRPGGAGPAPVPLEEVLDTFVFFPPGTSTFGTCTEVPSTSCAGGMYRKRFCLGGANGNGGNLEPLVARADHSTNSPAAGEPVEFTVEVRDDKEPLPGNISRVEIVYRVDGGPVQIAAMSYDGMGVRNAGFLLPDGSQGGRPLDLWTLWKGTVPGQPAGSRVEFFFRVEDAQGASSTQPRNLCAANIGPCDRNFGGPSCTRDPEDRDRYLECRKPFTYVSGYVPRGNFIHAVVNEVFASQNAVLRDPTSRDPAICNRNPPPSYCCKIDDPPECGYDDFIEIANTSDEPLDLSGLWLSDSYFEPRLWRFPPDSILPPRGYCKVWCDDDGGKCPDPTETNPPGFWECPDPTNPARNEYHANFALNAANDQIFLFDDEEHGFGLIHGVAFRNQLPNFAYALCPDGDRSGSFVMVEGGTPGEPNTPKCAGPPEPRFKRGDSNSDCIVDITDAIFTLGFLFIGGPTPGCLDAADADDNGAVEITDAIRTLGFLFIGGLTLPPPGHAVAGVDPTGGDTLVPCTDPMCP
jgi:hypothetical protein